MRGSNVISADRLRSFIERVEKLEEERKAIGGDIRDVYTEAKGVGYDVKIMRKIVSIRRMEPADRAEQEELLDTYMHALGMAVPAPRREPTEEELEARASRIADEVDRCMALAVDGNPPKIAAIQELIGCSTGKAHKLRVMVEQRISRSNAVERENETPPRGAETGEILDAGNPVSSLDAPRETDMARAARWAAGPNTGLSSLAIMAVMTGGKPRGWYCYPADSSDFGRCVGLLEAVPEWRGRIGEMATVGPEWGAIAAAWSELEQMYAAGKAMHFRIRELVQAHEEKRSGLVRLGESVTAVMDDDLAIPDILRRERAGA